MNTAHLVKKAQQRLFFLRKLKRAGLSPQLLTNFYRATIESILCLSAPGLNIRWPDPEEVTLLQKLESRVFSFPGESLSSLSLHPSPFSPLCLKEEEELRTKKNLTGY
ncbi:hypothetical protein L3Q82_014562 [Scortum barcoo]|uniref:Uncharacterized protein n=1 Tax=Scortum barcoo TaxID=214431 RepID=A0ACB8VYG8_9TELE|nr:hypothetical protein L3Q82_014562 [Scortum barcoo]